MKHTAIQEENLKKAPKVFKMPDGEYDIIPKEAVMASKMLVDAYIKAGSPQSPFTPSGHKIMNVIIAIWEDLYPIEAKVRHNEIKEHLQAEKTTKEQVFQHTGRSLASYPMPIYQMMKKVFPLFKPAERKNCMKMVKLWPMFKLVNKV
ncbi:MAG: hypothetical protein ACTSPI_05220 [Candidatus Heimdallarchaeaceae archaeon]